MPVVYTAEVVSTGSGRQGRVRSSDGLLDLNLASPKEVGGSGAGSNPEQLFAAGFAACFHSALRLAARAEGVELVDDAVTVSVDLIREPDGFTLGAGLVVEMPGLDQATADALAVAAHERCPYAKAVRGNVTVALRAKV